MSAIAYGRIERNETDISLKRINQIAEALNTDVETLLNFDSKKHIIHMENNQGSIYTSVNYGTVNAVIESLLQTIAKLNDNIVQLNNVVLQYTKKMFKRFIFIILIVFVNLKICFTQIIVYQDIFKGGVTGDAYNAGFSFQTGQVDIYIEPGSTIRKVKLFV